MEEEAKKGDRVQGGRTIYSFLEFFGIKEDAKKGGIVQGEPAP